MRRNIVIDPRGGPIEVSGQILEPGPAPLKIDLWRRVRHPPPELVHVRSIKDLVAGDREFYRVGPPEELLGKVVTWVWVCSHLEPGQSESWRVQVDVRQGGGPVFSFPATYTGSLPVDRPLAELRVGEMFVGPP